MSEPLANARHERFAQLVASGMAQGRAYEQAGYSAQGRSADANAAALIAKANVFKRVASLKAGNAKRAARSRDDAVADLESMAYGSDDSVSPGDRIRAHTLLAKLHGWERAPEPSDRATKIEVAVTPATLGELQRIARRKPT